MDGRYAVKRGQAEFPVLPLIVERWSPYLFAPFPVPTDAISSCLEAARWAASSYNEQPWRFIVAHRENQADFERLLSCLLDANQAWANRAGVLILTVVARVFSRNGNPNRMAEHDLGLAVGNLSLQATALGLHVHQMAGINPSKARLACGIPEGFDPHTTIAIGYVGVPAGAADAALAQRDQAARQRRPQSQFVFSGKWDSTVE